MKNPIAIYKSLSPKTKLVSVWLPFVFLILSLIIPISPRILSPGTSKEATVIAGDTSEDIYSDVFPTIMYSNGIHVFSVENRGEAISRNLKASFGFMRVIQAVSPNKNSRIEIIEGGVGANFVSFKVTELLPGETQYLYITTPGSTLRDRNVWSETEGDITDKLYSGWYKVEFGETTSTSDQLPTK